MFNMGKKIQESLPSKDLLISDASSLWDEICKRGLEPNKQGRDEALLDQLMRKLDLKKGNIREQLEIKNVKIEEFVYAFFSIVEPFVKMYVEIYSIMQNFNARKTKENMLVKFDFAFSEGKLEFDINRFKDRYEIFHRIKNIEIIWSDKDFQKLFDLLRIVGLDFKHVQGSHLTRYERKKNFKLLAVPYFKSELYEVLTRVRNAVQKAIEYVDFQEKIDAGSSLWGLYCILTDLVPSLQLLFSQTPEKLESITPDKMQEAVEYFRKEILDKLPVREVEKTIREIVDILSLPFWKYRWYLYEVWAALQTIDAFEEFSADLNMDSSGTIAINRGKVAELGKIDTSKGTLKLMTQLQTPLVGVRGRKGVQPDLRLCDSPENDPNNTVLMIELKQRKNLTSKYLSQLAQIYEKGCPNSLRNYFLCYDALRRKILVSSVRTSILENFNPSDPCIVNAYKKEIVSNLAIAGHEPVRVYDAVLFDTSASMDGKYEPEEIQQVVKNLLEKYHRSRIFFFNTKLTEQMGKNITIIIESLKINHGSTALEPCLQQLHNLGEIKRILLITDGEYGDAPSLSKFQVTECQPTYAQISSCVQKT